MTENAIDHAAWLFDPVTREVTVGATDCSCVTFRDGSMAGRAVRFPWVPCDKCKGTGKRGNGKCRGCAYHRDSRRNGPDYRPGLVPDYATMLDDGPCRVCEGHLLVPGDGNAKLPADILTTWLASVEVAIQITTVQHSWVEEHIGLSRLDHEAFDARAYTVISDYGTRWRDLVKAKEADTLPDALASLRAEVQAHLDREVEGATYKSVCNWAVKRGRGDTWIMPNVVMGVVSPSGMRILAIHRKEPGSVVDVAA